jgi:hypothetical protein
MDAKAESEVEGDDRRVHSRITRVELVVRFAGQTYKTANWSMGGFLLDDYDGMLSTGSLVTVEGLGCSSCEMHTVQLPARVVRSGASVVAVNYLGLDAEAYAFLQRAMSDSGKMRNLLEQNA